MSEKGIIIGCDKNQEWLLPWWWENYQKHNDYPVAFFDFGMSEQAISFCRDKGLYREIPKELVIEDISSMIQDENLKAWEEYFSKEKFWASRPGWLKKCVAAFLSPFQQTIWLDMDCQVHSNLKSLYEFLDQHDIAMIKEDVAITLLDHVLGSSYIDEPLYNTGVIAFRSQSPIISKWFSFTKENKHAFSGDEHMLSRLLYENQIPVNELPIIYNLQGIYPGLNPVITHYAGMRGKEYLKSQIAYSFEDPFHHLNQENP